MDAVPELANLNLRRAITFALDRDSITNDVLKDGSSPAYTAVPAQFATGPDGSDFSADQTKFAEFCAYDPDKAAEYYEQAKAELGKDSFSFTMVVDADDAPQKVAQVVQEQLQTTLPGFTLELKVEPKKQRVQDMQDGNFEIGLTRWGPDYADPMTYLACGSPATPTTTVCGATLTTMPSSQSAPPAICAPIPRAAGKPCMTLSPSCWSRPPSSRCMVSATPR